MDILFLFSFFLYKTKNTTGEEIYKYLKTVGDDKKEALMGLGSKYVGDLLGKVKNSNYGKEFLLILQQCYPKVLELGGNSSSSDSYYDRASAGASDIYNSMSATDLDSAGCKKKLFNSIHGEKIADYSRYYFKN